MNTVHRRTEIINILIIRRHTTANELAQEFGVSIRTIQYDIQALTPVYPIYTKQGENGGIFIREDYKPYANSLTPMEVAALHELYDWTEGIHKKVLFQVLENMDRINYNFDLVILIKHIIFTEPFIADGSVLMCFLG